MIWRDKDGDIWREHPHVAGAWQILITETAAWSDAELSPYDGPFIGDCGVEDCRICTDLPYGYDDLIARSDATQAVGSLPEARNANVERLREKFHKLAVPQQENRQ